MPWADDARVSIAGTSPVFKNRRAKLFRRQIARSEPGSQSFGFTDGAQDEHGSATVRRMEFTGRRVTAPAAGPSEAVEARNQRRNRQWRMKKRSSNESTRTQSGEGSRASMQREDAKNNQQ